MKTRIIIIPYVRYSQNGKVFFGQTAYKKGKDKRLPHEILPESVEPEVFVKKFVSQVDWCTSDVEIKRLNFGSLINKDENLIYFSLKIGYDHVYYPEDLPRIKPHLAGNKILYFQDLAKFLENQMALSATDMLGILWLDRIINIDDNS